MKCNGNTKICRYNKKMIPFLEPLTSLLIIYIVVLSYYPPILHTAKKLYSTLQKKKEKKNFCSIRLLIPKLLLTKSELRTTCLAISSSCLNVQTASSFNKYWTVLPLSNILQYLLSIDVTKEFAKHEKK